MCMRKIMSEYHMSVSGNNIQFVLHNSDSFPSLSHTQTYFAFKNALDLNSTVYEKFCELIDIFRNTFKIRLNLKG